MPPTSCPNCEGLVRDFGVKPLSDETRKTIEDARMGIGVTRYENLEDAFNSLFDDPEFPPEHVVDLSILVFQLDEDQAREAYSFVQGLLNTRGNSKTSK